MDLRSIVIITHSCLLAFVVPCFGMTPEETEVFEKAVYAANQWNPSFRIGEPPPDVKRLDSLEEQYLKWSASVYEKAFSVERFEENGSLWQALLNNPKFNWQTINRTLPLLDNTTFPKQRRLVVLDIVVASTLKRELEGNFLENIRALAKFAAKPGFYSDAQCAKLVETSISRGDINLLLVDAFAPSFTPETKAFFEKAAHEGERLSGRALLATSILAKHGDDKSLRRIKEAAVIKKPDIGEIACVPACLAYIGHPDLVAMLFKMLESDLSTEPCNDTTPSRAQLCHSAASALSLIVYGFPKYDYWQEFSQKDKTICIEWARKHGSDYRIINRPAYFFYEKSVLQY